jgi:transposase
MNLVAANRFFDSLIGKGEARQYVADLLNVGRSTLYRNVERGHCKPGV